MGVSGSGKSTLGAALADVLNATFIDADDLHPARNIAQMAGGAPLTDAMRWPWLEACGAAMAEQDRVVLACSSLKRSYRDLLRAQVDGVQFVYPHITHDVIRARLDARAGHFMQAGLLDSQFDTLDEPARDEDHIRIDGMLSIAECVTAVADALRAR